MAIACNYGNGRSYRTTAIKQIIMKQFRFRKKDIVSEVDSQKAMKFEISTHHFRGAPEPSRLQSKDQPFGLKFLLVIFTRSEKKILCCCPIVMYWNTHMVLYRTVPYGMIWYRTVRYRNHMSNSAVLYHAMYYSTVAEERIIQYIQYRIVRYWYRTGLFLWYNTPYWYNTGTVPAVIIAVIILVMYQQDPWVPYSTILHIP